MELSIHATLLEPILSFVMNAFKVLIIANNSKDN